ncbi:MAG: hypothetical protein V1845_01940 [bacterium]
MEFMVSVGIVAKNKNSCIDYLPFTFQTNADSTIGQIMDTAKEHCKAKDAEFVMLGSVHFKKINKDARQLCLKLITSR